MAVTKVVSSLDFINPGAGMYEGICTFPGPSSYATGGIPVDLQTELGLPGDPDWVDAKQDVNFGSVNYAYDCQYDRTNQKVQLFLGGTTTEVSAATNLTAYTFRLKYSGKRNQ